MKKSFLFLLMTLLSLTASALGFTVNGIWYEPLGGYDPNVAVRGIADGEICPSQLIIPSTVTDANGDTYKVITIDEYAFMDRTELVSLYIHDNVEVIGANAFAGCTNLKYIRFPETLNCIGHPLWSQERGAFEGCTSLESIYLPKSLNHQPYVTSPNNICKWAFKNCTKLKTVIIAAEYPVIEDEAFLGCTSLTYLVSNISEPWALEPNTFQGIPSSATLIVPDGTRTSYLGLTGWNSFSNITERSNSTRVFATLTAGKGGKISSGSMEIQQGTSVWPVVKSQSLIVSITPDEGRSLLRLLKDGQDVTSSVSGGKYTVQNVQQDFTLEAVFQEGTTPDPQPGGGTARLSIEPFTINPGETATMLIDMTNPDDEITALDFFLQLPQGLSIAMEDGEPALDIAGRTTWKKHTLTVNTTDGHIMLYSATNATVSGTSGALISVKLQASSTFAGGDIVLKNQTLNTPVPVVSKPADYVYTITLDEPTPQITMKAEILNAIDGVVYENQVRFRVTAETEDEDNYKLKLFYYLYKISDNGNQEKVTGTSESFFLSVKDTRELRGDGHYKVEYGYLTAKGKEVVLGSTPFECRIDDRYITIVMEDEMRTFSHEQDLNFANTKGLKAYTAGGFNTSSNEALMMRVLDVPAETGLLLVGQPGAYLVEKGTSTTVYVNMLKAIVKSTHIDRMEGNYFNYVFTDGEEGLGFYLASNGTSLDSNSAILQLRWGVAGNLPIVKMIFDDTTAIGDLPAQEQQPFDVYSLSGLLVKRGATTLKGLPAGIYVVNGRKMVVR